VIVRQESGYAKRQRAGEQLLLTLDHGHPLAELDRGRSQFQSDEAAADYGDGAACLERRPQSAGVCHVAQRVDALEIRAGPVEAPRLGAGGEDQLRPAESALRALRRAAGQIDRSDRAVEDEVDALLRVELGAAQQDLLARTLARQERLGERRPMVGQVALGG
jgi:hypothetical protein